MTETEAAARWKVASSDFGEVAIHYLKGDELVASFELIGLYVAPTFHGNEFVAQLREVLEARTAILGGPLVAQLTEALENAASWMRAAASTEHANHAALHRDDPIDECGNRFCVSSMAASAVADAALKAAADAQQSADAPAAGVNQWETFPIDGHVQKNDGTDWTPKESEAFFDAFLAWIESRDLGFGGGLGHSDALKWKSADAQREE